ncbi:MAG: M48 family metallopeptidase [Clostridia bacterium]
MILKSVRDNKIQSFGIILGFLIIVTLFIYFVCYLMDLGPYSIVIALAFSTISSFLSYYNCDKLVLAMNGARKATPEQDQLLSTLLDGLCIASGLPKPKLYVVNDPSPNAFATGRNPENAVICVTTGLLERMDKYELEGVLAHELSHIKNYDILLSTVISVFAGFVVMISDFVLRYGFRRRRDSDDKSPLEGILLIVGLIFIILSPIFTKLIQLAVSRKREYLADATAIEFTRNPNGLISALKKLQNDDSSMKNVSNATAHMYISEPLKKKREKTDIFSTHPPISERIARLENIN